MLQLPQSPMVTFTFFPSARWKVTQKDLVPAEVTRAWNPDTMESHTRMTERPGRRASTRLSVSLMLERFCF